MTEFREREIRSGVANSKMPGSRAFPHRLKREQQEGRRPEMHHYPGEGFRGLVHGVIEARERRGI